MRSLFYTFIFLLTCQLMGFGQGVRHKIYLNAMMRETASSTAEYTLELTAKENAFFEGVIQTKQNVIKARGGYVRENKQFLEHGYFVYFYEGGNIESEGYFDRGVKVGAWHRYTEDGVSKPDRYYDPKSADLVRSAITGTMQVHE